MLGENVSTLLTAEVEVEEASPPVSVEEVSSQMQTSTLESEPGMSLPLSLCVSNGRRRGTYSPWW